MMKTMRSIWPLLLSLPAPAFAHTGAHTGGSFFSGLLHPLSGLDHLLVMLAVGVWAVLAMRRYVWQPAALFIGCLAVGAWLGMRGVSLPGTEAGIAASVLVMGLLLMAWTRIAALPGLALIAVFALLHGHAHGLEMPSGSAPWVYAAGFVTTTAGLHLAGVALGLAAVRFRAQWVLRGAGLATGAAGAWLLLGA